jgi:hypothetical protein
VVGRPPGLDVATLKEGISGVGGDGDARDGLRFGGEGVSAAVLCGGLRVAVLSLRSMLGIGVAAAFRAGDFPGIRGGGGRGGGEAKVEKDIV